MANYTGVVGRCSTAHRTIWGSRTIYQEGKYDFSMGTHVFFEEDEEPLPVDSIYEKHAKRTFKYLDKTNKVLNFSRIFVEPESNSKEPTGQDDSSDKTDGKNPLEVDLTYEEVLQQLISKDNN